MSALKCGQFTLNKCRRRTLAARFEAFEKIALQVVLVGHEALDVRVRRIRLRHLVEQVERASRGGSEIRNDGRDDAARGAGNDEHAVAGEREPAAAVSRQLLLQADHPALLGFMAHLDDPGIA